MKKSNEMFIFLALLVIPLVLLFVIFPFSSNMLLSSPGFVGVGNYIRMFLNDKTFGKALLNTILAPAIVSSLLVSVFAVIVFIVRKKIKVPRWVFYLGSVLIGGVTTLLYTYYLSIVFSHMTSSLFAAQTIITQIVDYNPYVNVITFQNVFFSLYIGILTAFIFWILELVVDIIKNFIRKRNM